MVQYDRDKMEHAPSFMAKNKEACSDCSNLWSVSRYNTNNAWYSNGTNGYFNNNNFNNTYAALGVAQPIKHQFV